MTPFSPLFSPIFSSSQLRLFSLSPLCSTLSAHTPMDQVKGILAYIQARHPDKGYELDGVMSILVSCTRRPEDLPEEIALNVRAIIEIAGKSIQTLHRTISLLKLSDEIQSAIDSCFFVVAQKHL